MNKEQQHKRPSISLKNQRQNEVKNQYVGSKDVPISLNGKRENDEEIKEFENKNNRKKFSILKLIALIFGFGFLFSLGFLAFGKKVKKVLTTKNIDTEKANAVEIQNDQLEFYSTVDYLNEIEKDGFKYLKTELDEHINQPILSSGSPVSIRQIQRRLKLVKEQYYPLVGLERKKYLQSYHLVKQGETCFRIAQIKGTTVEILRLANPIIITESEENECELTLGSELVVYTLINREKRKESSNEQKIERKIKRPIKKESYTLVQAIDFSDQIDFSNYSIDILNTHLSNLRKLPNGSKRSQIENILVNIRCSYTPNEFKKKGYQKFEFPIDMTQSMDDVVSTITRSFGISEKEIKRDIYRLYPETKSKGEIVICDQENFIAFINLKNK